MRGNRWRMNKKNIGANMNLVATLHVIEIRRDETKSNAVL
jgi:hypothetical protein